MDHPNHSTASPQVDRTPQRNKHKTTPEAIVGRRYLVHEAFKLMSSSDLST
jgi:hypothetical protein